VNDALSISDSAFGLGRLMPLKITIQGLGELQPKHDITPLESAHLAMALTGALFSGEIGMYYVDIVGFIKEHGLERHFRP
jgi:hypothetical protein